MHQLAAGQRLPVRSVSTLLARRGARLIAGWARDIDLARRTVDVDGRHVGYDALVIALGSRTDVTRVPGAREHAHTLDADGQARLRAALGSLSVGGRVVVAGGGLTAIEAASEIAESFPGLSVRLVTAGVVGEQLSRSAQGLSRAKRQLKAKRPRFASSRESHERLLTAFLRAVSLGDVKALTALFAEDVIATATGAARSRRLFVPSSGGTPWPAAPWVARAALQTSASSTWT